MLQQDLAKNPVRGLLNLYLYLNMGTTDDQITDPSYRANLHDVTNLLCVCSNVLCPNSGE